MAETKKIHDAIIFAAKAHEGQRRKGTDIPYITHPFEVAQILMEAGCDETLIIAGLLHDTLEDTEVYLFGWLVYILLKLLLYLLRHLYGYFRV